MIINKYDKVKLLDKFKNKIIYTVVKIRETGIISLCPVDGGIIVSAHIKNLQKV